MDHKDNSTIIETGFDKATSIDNDFVSSGFARSTKIDAEPPGAGQETAAPGKEITNISLNNKNYSILERLAVASGEAEIYLIEDPAGNKIVLKQYRPGLKPKEDIVNIIRSLPETCVIKIIESGLTPDGRFYELQQFAQAGSLNQYLKHNGPVSREFIKEFIAGLNECLNQIHSINVIHRDIKPDNILLKKTAPLELVLTDFGISSISEMSLHQTGLSRTITYSSPESMSGIVSKASDYWALGLITLEMLINKNPFHGSDDKVIMFTLATKNVPCINEADGEFSCLIKGLLTRNPRKRWSYKQVKSWLAGDKNIPVHFDENLENADRSAGAGLRKIKPYNFCGAGYTDIVDLTLAMSKNWDAAREELESDRLRDWIVRELQIPRLATIIEDIGCDEKLSPDQKMFELFCRFNPAQRFIYKGILTTEEFLTGTAVKILNSQPISEDENSVISCIKDGWAAKKYIEIINRDPFSEKCVKLSESLLNAPDDIIFHAKIILVSFSEVYKNKLIENIKSLFERKTLIKPVKENISIEDILSAARDVCSGKNQDELDLIIIGDSPAGCFIENTELEEKSAAFKNSFRHFTANITREELLKRVLKFADYLPEKMVSDRIVDSMFEISDSRTEYSYQYFVKLEECSQCLIHTQRALRENIRELSLRLKEKIEDVKNIRSSKELDNMRTLIETNSDEGFARYDLLVEAFSQFDNVFNDGKKIRAAGIERKITVINIILITASLLALYSYFTGRAALLYFAVAIAVIGAVTFFKTEQEKEILDGEKPPVNNNVVLTGERQRLSLDIGDGVILELVRIPAGEFAMGRNDGPENERPEHKVKITNVFFIGKFLVTQLQWKKLMPKDPSAFEKGEDYPVDRVSYKDCRDFINALNALRLVRGKFCLPAEAEWEYACRAGTSTQYYWGGEFSGEYCWHVGNSGHSTQAVGQKKPNHWGLYDMNGNLWEWCEDWYGNYTPEGSADPSGPLSGHFKVRRGGGWDSREDSCNSTCRAHYLPDSRYDRIGFRVALKV